MKEHPVLMHARSIKAIRAGLKTQTRRIVKLDLSPKEHAPWLRGDGLWQWMTGKVNYESNTARCPFGEPGDILWSREAWTHRAAEHAALYRADYDPVEQAGIIAMYSGDGKWRPSIHMPRKYARLFLEVLTIKVERIQSISKEDIEAEGIRVPDSAFWSLHFDAFKTLWDDTNGQRAWERNDWVWAVQFKPVAAPETKWVGR